jgi:RNA polymerase sigma-70 factor (ECF subfamily)
MAELVLARMAPDTETPAGSQLAIDEFAALYRDHVKTVVRTLRRAGVQPDAIDDCAQEVFVVAARRLQSRPLVGSLRAWLVGVARNVAAHELRARSRAQRRDRCAPPPGGTRSPEQDVQTRERLAFVESFIEGLAESQREVFVLAQIEGLTAPEIAELLGVNCNTVYTRLMRARRAFQLAIGERRARSGEDDDGAR